MIVVLDKNLCLDNLPNFQIFLIIRVSRYAIRLRTTFFPQKIINNVSQHEFVYSIATRNNT